VLCALVDILRILRYDYYIRRTVHVHGDYIFTVLYWLLILPYRITTNRSLCILSLWDSFLWITVLLSRNTKKMQVCNRIYYSKGFLKAQYVSSGTPRIISICKLYLQHMVTGRCQGWMGNFPLSLGKGRSPYGHINQRLQIQFRAPNVERCAARNILSLQKKNFGIINSIAKLHLVGISTE
jgi:hypothetical protein